MPEINGPYGNFDVEVSIVWNIRQNLNSFDTALVSFQGKKAPKWPSGPPSGPRVAPKWPKNAPQNEPSS